MAVVFKLSVTLLSQAKCHSIDFLTIDSYGIATSVCQAAKEWVKATSNAMRDLDMPKFVHLHLSCANVPVLRIQSTQRRIADFNEKLKSSPDSMEELKAILTAISTIRQQGIAVNGVLQCASVA